MAQKRDIPLTLPKIIPSNNSSSIPIIVPVSIGIFIGFIILWIVWACCPRPTFIHRFRTWYHFGRHPTPLPPPPPPPPPPPYLLSPELQTVTTTAIDTEFPLTVIGNNPESGEVVNPVANNNNNNIELTDFPHTGTELLARSRD